MTRRFGTLAITAVLGFGCAAPRTTHPPAAAEHRFIGRVVHANGTPASGATIVVSDASKGDVLSTLRAGRDGRFATNLAPAVYALTAADAEQAVYVASVDGTRGPVEIRLDASCALFEGRIVAEARPTGAPIVLLRRHSEEIADSFGAALEADGSFRACLPPAPYRIEPPEGFIDRSAVVVIPSPRPFVFRTDARETADRVPPDSSGIAPESAETFVAGLSPSTRVLGLGETNHGTREFYEERAALALDLATNHGIRLVMLEAGYGEALALDDYVNGAQVDIARAVEQLGYWIWDTKTFLQVLAQIRAFNASVAADKRLHVIGIDIQDTRGAIEYLKQQGTTVLSADDTSALDKLAAEKGKAWKTLAPAERTPIRATLERIAAARVTSGVSSKQARAALAARSLLLRFDLWEAADPAADANLRDAGMARMVLDVLAVEPNSRATVWAHLAHLAREYIVGQRTMGAHLAAALGDRYRVYGLHALSGSVRAWDNKREIGVVANTLRSPPPHSLEAVLAAQSGGARVTYWTFARAKGDAARWLDGVHALRSFGAVFAKDEHEFSYWDVRSFDGSILFQSVTPTDPTATGERRAKPKQ